LQRKVRKIEIAPLSYESPCKKSESAEDESEMRKLELMHSRMEKQESMSEYDLQNSHTGSEEYS
jgi:hypothetical protein